MRGYVIGLDLGQASDWTAMAVLKLGESDQPDGLGGRLPTFDCVHLDRFPQMTPYPEIVAAVVRLCADRRLRYEADDAEGRILDLGPHRLAVDATGVGRSVVDMFVA